MLRRILTVALATVALAGVTTAPAYADPNPPYTATTISASGVTAGVFVSGLQINATCEADVVGLVAATVIKECRIYEQGYPGLNHPSAMPGNAAVSNFTQRVYSLDFVLCFEAYTIPLHNPNQIITTGQICAYDIFFYNSGVSFGSGSTTE